MIGEGFSCHLGQAGVQRTSRNHGGKEGILQETKACESDGGGTMKCGMLGLKMPICRLKPRGSQEWSEGTGKRGEDADIDDGDEDEDAIGRRHRQTV